MKYSIVDCPIIPTVLEAAFHKYDVEGIELPHSMQNMLQAARITSRARIFIVYLVAAIVFSIVGVLGLGCYVRKRMSRENDYDAVPVEQYQAATGTTKAKTSTDQEPREVLQDHRLQSARIGDVLGDLC